MSSHYWQRRWINALVEQGMDRKAAAQAYATTYADQAADFSKSPEIQSLMTFGVFNSKSNTGVASPQSSGAH